MILGDGLTTFNKINSANFSGEKSTKKLSKVSFFKDTRRKRKVKFRPRSRPSNAQI